MKKRTFITICTICRSHSYLLPHVYESLLSQTRFQFEWLIMDMDAGERTEVLVKEWKEENGRFPIRYIPCAKNARTSVIQKAIDLARGDYFCLVDTEEMLTEEAMACFLDWIEEIGDDDSIMGVSGAKSYLDGRPLSEKEPRMGIRGYVDATYLNRAAYGLETSQCEVLKTQILRSFPVLQCQGEDDTPFRLTLDETALQGYKVRWYREVVCRGEYLYGERTACERRKERRNPMGYAMLYNHRLRYREQSFGVRFDAACRHIALSICARHPEYILKSYDRKLSLLALLPGLLLALGDSHPFS